MPLIYLALALIVVGITARISNTYKLLPERIKAILNVVLALIVIGEVLWLINTCVPMAGSIRAILNIFVVAATCVGVLQVVDLSSGAVRLWSDFKSRRMSH